MSNLSPRSSGESAPFIPAPSRIVLHRCSSLFLGTPQRESTPAPASSSSARATRARSPSPQSQQPITALLLSLPLTQKIHAMLLTSRHIETLARRLFSGVLSEAEVARQMKSLEGRYEALQEAVEKELEGAWVTAGWLAPEIEADKNSGTDSEDSGRLKGRKRAVGDSDGEATSSSHGRKDKKRKLEKKQRQIETDWRFDSPPDPIGIPRALIPMARGDKERMLTWDWDYARGRGVSGRETCLSPKGQTVFVI
jgi:hypothetical protein